MPNKFRRVRNMVDDTDHIYDVLSINSEPTDREMSVALIDWEERSVKEVQVPSGVPKLYVDIGTEQYAKEIQEMGYGVYHKYDRRSRKKYKTDAYIIIPSREIPDAVSELEEKMGEQFPGIDLSPKPI